jgi:hypothetical protein
MYAPEKHTCEAVLDGSKSCPMDGRFLGRVARCSPTPMRGDVWSYIRTLYESVAETLPEDTDEEFSRDDPVLDDDCDCDDTPVVTSQQQADDLQGPSDVRKMPPGSIYEQWRQFKEVGFAGSYRLFWDVWTHDFPFLGFRGKRSHAQCSVCLKHKLLIRSFGNDARSRLKQRHLYDLHLKAQYADRKGYWHVRAEARLHMPVICIIIDAMDQAKFSYPRDPIFSAKEFDQFQRPRAHVYGGIAHGFFTLLTVSAADTCKGGSTTVDILAHMLTMLSKQVDLRKCEINVLLDNASGSNKNNTVFAFAGALVLCGLVGLARIMFLRVGHTHEELWAI